MAMECLSSEAGEIPEHRFRESASDKRARTGSFWTTHGAFETPNFMPVGTQGSVKGIDAIRLKEIGAQIMLVNTYHLWLRPGHDVVAELGGIHSFTAWEGPILSDSGGFQVFSLEGLRKITEEGVRFQSHIDGCEQFLTPEKSVEIQETLGVDIAMVLDECLPGKASREEAEQSLELTLGWAKRSYDARTKPEMALFGITQGGAHLDLRSRAAEALAEIPFDGMAIGGLSVGEPKEEMYSVLEAHAHELPKDKIRYLMGVGTPEDLVQAVSEGIDIFDCVMPTRAGRFGRAFTSGEVPFINIKNAKYRDDNEPIDERCHCLACRTYSRGYLNHLFKAGEMLGPQLLSVHNLTHYLALMREIRDSIAKDKFSAVYQRVRNQWRDVKQMRDEEAK